MTRALPLARRADGADVWRFGPVEVPNVALNAIAGRPKEEYGVEPQSLDEIRPGWTITSMTMAEGLPGALGPTLVVTGDARQDGSDQKPTGRLLLVDLGRPAEARPLHEEALRSLPGDARLLANYGMCLAALGETDRARETLDAALAANPDNAEALEARAKLDA